VSTLAQPVPDPAARLRSRRARLNRFDRRANRVLLGLCSTGGALVFVAMVEIAYQVINGASSAISRYGAGFLVHTQWVPNQFVFGAWTFIYGSLVTSLVSLVLATVLGVAIGIYLSMLAPRPVARIVGPLVEMLAAVPSVVLGFIGIVLIAPFVQGTIEPFLHGAFGFIPLFGPPQTTGLSIFTASLVLTIMVVPIISALTRDLFLTVPRELTEGAEALGSTRWEVIRGVVLPTTSSGIVAACVLGFGRALGEAIAVSQVVGGLAAAPVNLFRAGDTMASRVAIQFQSPDNLLHTSSLYYLAVILFAFGITTNFIAGQITRRAARS
jgi:phosphate transport system permease protein